MFSDIPDYWKKIHQRCLAGATERGKKRRFDRSDGSVLLADWVIRPWHLASGAIGGIVIFSDGITVGDPPDGHRKLRRTAKQKDETDSPAESLNEPAERESLERMRVTRRLRPNDRVHLDGGRNHSVVSPAAIHSIRADCDYSHVRVENGRDILVRCTMKEWEAFLRPDRFIRIHRSHILNMKSITGFERLPNGTLLVRVRGDDAQYKVSRRRAAQIAKRIDSFYAHPGLISPSLHEKSRSIACRYGCRG